MPLLNKASHLNWVTNKFNDSINVRINLFPIGFHDVTLFFSFQPYLFQQVEEKHCVFFYSTKTDQKHAVVLMVSDVVLLITTQPSQNEGSIICI